MVSPIRVTLKVNTDVKHVSSFAEGFLLGSCTKREEVVSLFGKLQLLVVDDNYGIIVLDVVLSGKLFDVVQNYCDVALVRRFLWWAQETSFSRCQWNRHYFFS